MTVYAGKNIAKRSVDIMIGRVINGQEHLATPLYMAYIPTPEGTGLVLEPTLSLPWETGQELMQALWDAGLRPNKDEGSAGHVQALTNHIKFAERVCERLMTMPPPMIIGRDHHNVVLP